MFVRVTNESKGALIASRVKVADSMSARLRGLLGTVSLPVDQGLWLTPCRSVHMFFMKYPIDVLFLDEQGMVLSQSTLAPWSVSSWERRAAGALELAAGTIERTKTQVGDRLTLKPI